MFEHSREDLVGRGAGIVTHADLFASLDRVGVVADESFGVDIPQRVALDRGGNAIDTIALPQCLTVWGKLYSLLKAAFPAECYHLEHSVTRVDPRNDRVIATFANGATAEAELLVGADGIRSTVRTQLAPEVRPDYAGYVGWRGLVDESALTSSTREALIPKLGFSLGEREHMVGYPVAGRTRSTRIGERSYNFVWYRPVEESRDYPDLCTDINGRRHDMSVPPPLVRPDLVDGIRRAAHDLLAPQFAEVVEKAPQPFFQAIYDVESQRIAFGRVALLGDAAFVARPHCGMGVSKGAGDAMALIDALRAANGEVSAALERYNAVRVPFGMEVVRYGQKLGAYLGGDDSEEARRHHTPRAVIREIAVPWEAREYWAESA